MRKNTSQPLLRRTPGPMQKEERSRQTEQLFQPALKWT
jgi:hypothetical protein